MERPRLKPGIAIAAHGDDAALAKGPGTFVRYQAEGVGLALPRFAAALNGQRTLADAAREAGIPLDDAQSILETLDADRLVEDAASTSAAPPGAAGALFAHLTRDPAAAIARIHNARFLVSGEGSVADAARATLKEFGAKHVATGDAPEGHDHVLLLSDAPDSKRFLRMNDACLTAKVAWTSAFIDGFEATVGPTVIPWETACWRCYQLRAFGAHPQMDRAMAMDSTRVGPTHLPSSATIVGSWAAQAAALTTSRVVAPPLGGAVTRVDLLGLRATRHRVLRLPRCPACTRAPIPDVDRYAVDGVR